MNGVHIGLALGVTLIWSLNFIVIKVGLGTFPPLFFSSLRFAVAAFPAVLFVKRDGLTWRWILMLGLILGVAVYGLIFIALDRGMPAGLTSLIIQVHVLFTFVLSAVFLHDRPSIWQWIGVCIAFVGIAILVFDAQGDSKLIAILLVLGSGFAWAVSNLLLKRIGCNQVFRLMVWMSIVPPLPLLVLSLIFEQGQWQALVHMNWSACGALLYAGWISTILGFAIWATLIRHYSPNQVAPWGLLVPILSMALSGLLLQETYSREKIVASVLILMGLTLLICHQRLGRYLDRYKSPHRSIPAEVIFDYFRIK